MFPSVSMSSHANQRFVKQPTQPKATALLPVSQPIVSQYPAQQEQPQVQRVSQDVLRMKKSQPMVAPPQQQQPLHGQVQVQRVSEDVLKSKRKSKNVVLM